MRGCPRRGMQGRRAGYPVRLARAGGARVKSCQPRDEGAPRPGVGEVSFALLHKGIAMELAPIAFFPRAPFDSPRSVSRLGKERESCVSRRGGRIAGVCAPGRRELCPALFQPRDYRGRDDSPDDEWPRLNAASDWKGSHQRARAASLKNIQADAKSVFQEGEGGRAASEDFENCQPLNHSREKLARKTIHNCWREKWTL